MWDLVQQRLYAIRVLAVILTPCYPTNLDTTNHNMETFFLQYFLIFAL